MPERRPSALITDILRAIDHIQQYTNDLTPDQFTKDFMAVEACLYNIQVIGEAVSRLPDDVRIDHPQIPWPLIKGMRNRLIHEYFGTDFLLVWNVIKNELPPLIPVLRNIHILLINKNR